MPDKNSYCEVKISLCLSVSANLTSYHLHVIIDSLKHYHEFIIIDTLVSKTYDCGLPLLKVTKSRGCHCHRLVQQRAPRNFAT